MPRHKRTSRRKVPGPAESDREWLRRTLNDPRVPDWLRQLLAHGADKKWYALWKAQSAPRFEDHDLEVVLFLQAMTAQRFKQRPEDEWRMALNIALNQPEVRRQLARTIRAVHRFKRQHAGGRSIKRLLPTGRAKRDLRGMMREFAAALYAAPALIRPVLWRYAWEEGRKAPLTLIPEWQSPYVQLLQGVGPEASTLGGLRHPYVGIIFDPFLASDTHLDGAIAAIRASFGTAVKAGRAPTIKHAVQMAALQIGYYFDYFGPATGSFKEQGQKAAWETYRATHTPTRRLVEAIRECVQGLLGTTRVSKSVVEKTLREWQPPPRIS